MIEKDRHEFQRAEYCAERNIGLRGWFMSFFSRKKLAVRNGFVV
jgi:hypothetical protein